MQPFFNSIGYFVPAFFAFPMDPMAEMGKAPASAAHPATGCVPVLLRDRAAPGQPDLRSTIRLYAFGDNP